MKKSLIILTLVFINNLFFGQSEAKIIIPIDSITQKYTYTKIIEVPDKNASDLFLSTKKWCIQKYLNDKFIIEETDSKLIYIGNFPINTVIKVLGRNAPQAFTVLFSLTTLFKNGKCKVELSNFKLTQNSQGTTNERTLEAYNKNVESYNRTGKKYIRLERDSIFNEVDSNAKKILLDLEKELKGENQSKKEW